MGNEQSSCSQSSSQVFRKLSKELPPVKTMAYDENWINKDMGWKVFSDDKDREQFIYSVIAVATNNGLLNLEDHDLKLLYARREGDAERVVARIVAIKDGVIRAKIEPEADGKDQRSAFVALRKDVEVRLDRLLQGVPGGSTEGEAGSSMPAAISPLEETRLPRIAVRELESLMGGSDDHDVVDLPVPCGRELLPNKNSEAASVISSALSSPECALKEP